jgi:transposase InsO family protein
MSAFEFIRSEKAKNDASVSTMCRVLGVSRSGFYAWSTRLPSARARRNVTLESQIRSVHIESGKRYGSIKVTRALRRVGEVVSVKMVAKVMRKSGLVARRKRRFKVTTDSRNSIRHADNLLERNFSVVAPNQAWVTDVTAYWTYTGWLYLAAVIDLFARRVVGWAISEHNDTALALAALRKSYQSRKPAFGLIHHSDRGSPYASDDYIAELEKYGMKRSMSNKGDCWDNAVAESFFSTLEFECVRGVTYESHNALTLVLSNYIEQFYNPKRMHATLGYVSPIEAELSFNLKSQAA